MPKVDEYYSFYSWFLLGLGLVFQLPVVIFVLARIGLVTPGFLLRQFKYAVLVSFVISPSSPPPPTWSRRRCWRCPMIGLYLLGVGVAWLFGRDRGASADDGQRRKLEADAACPRATFSRRACPAFSSTT